MGLVVVERAPRLSGNILGASTGLLVVLAVGCAPVPSTCSWVVPEADAAIEVVAPRRPVAGECRCIGCRAPGEFALRRNAYPIEFWNGDRWDPDLFVRARTPAGQPLEIRSSRLVENRPVTPLPSQYMEFDYFLPITKVGGKAPPSGSLGALTMEIVDASGTILGTEEVTLNLETRKDWILEGI